MIETICTPYGKAAFPTVVKCDGCGEEIDSGWMHSYSAKLDGNDVLLVDEDRHWCDECAENLGEQRSEFRVCDRCRGVMTFGFCDDVEHVCEDCWDAFVAETFPDGFRETPEDEKEEDDDYYQAYDKGRGEWYVVGWYWTQWD